MAALIMRPEFRIVPFVGLSTGLAAAAYDASIALLPSSVVDGDFYLAGVGLLALLAGYRIAKGTGKPAVVGLNPLSRLTRRELEILARMAEGKSNKQIAALYFVEISTIKTHINNLYAKLNVCDRRSAAAEFEKHSSFAKSTHSPPGGN